MPRKSAADRALRRHLEAIPPERLVELLMQQTARDDDLRERLLIEAARDQRTAIDIDAFRRSIDDAILESGTRYRGYGYTSADWARGIHAVTARLGALVDAGFAAESVALTEHALETLGEAMDHTDDSNGYFAGVRDALEDVHHQACVAAHPDLLALARRLFAHEVDGGWEIFLDAAERYSDVLGGAGLAEYRRLAEERWQRLRALTPADRTRTHSERGRFALTQIMETLAKRDGDVDALVAVKRHNLSYPYHFLQIAELLHAANREAHAIAWAERGVAAFPDWPDTRLDAFLCDAYQRAGRHDEAVALARRRFAAQPELDEYRFLAKVARRAGAWAEQRERAIAVLTGAADGEALTVGTRGGSAAHRDALVEVLLWEQRVDEAWAEAGTRQCSHFVWLRLAAAREADHPADAIPIYQREVDAIVAGKNNRAYAETVAMLRRIRDLFARADRADEFADYVTGVRAAHKAKRNLMKLFDAEGWLAT